MLLTPQGLILVDSPARVALHNLGSQKGNVLHGGFEDITTSHLSSQSSVDQCVWSRDSMLESLVHYLQCPRPYGLTTTPTSMLHLVYYPIRITLSYWNYYNHLLSRYSKHYEYSLQDISSRLYGSDITDLQRWRRRIRQSRHKLTLLTEFCRYWVAQEDIDTNKSTWNSILRDIEYLQYQLQDYNQSLEQMVTVATSMLQLLDSRQSILEAVNVRRLTYLALIFAPLAWVASLFSMSEPYLPGQGEFWVYFATAIPLLCTVFLLSTFNYDLLGQRLAGYWRGIVDGRQTKHSRRRQNALEP
jgi:Mg2+ and Co2+ transporter CorA